MNERIRLDNRTGMLLTLEQLIIAAASIIVAVGLIVVAIVITNESTALRSQVWERNSIPVEGDRYVVD